MARWGVVTSLAVFVALGGCGESDGNGDDSSAQGPMAGVSAAPPCAPDESDPVPARDVYGEWTKVELPDTFCSDGSQYKFFVNFSATSNNLVVMFEPGGACWDYAGCTGQTSLGAANPNGIPDDHMDTWSVAYPVWANGEVGSGKDGKSLSFMKDYNRVFLPYCTGDVFVGNKTATYASEDGADTITYRHVGHLNLERVVPWLNATFPTVPKLVVGGCSAGGIGALNNYHLLRSGIEGSQCGYLFNDSGPLFSSAGASGPLHTRIRDAWNVSYATDKLRPAAATLYGPGAAFPLDEDFGRLNEMLALLYPADRLTISVYRSDFNYSLYSYDTFNPGATNDMIFDLWGEDLDQLAAQYDRFPNLGYYIAHSRTDNCSHCLSIVPLDHIAEALAGAPFLGTEIEAVGVNLHDYYVDVLEDGRPLPSYRETQPPAGEVLSDAERMMCRGAASQ